MPNSKKPDGRDGQPAEVIGKNLRKHHPHHRPERDGKRRHKSSPRDRIDRAKHDRLPQRGGTDVGEELRLNVAAHRRVGFVTWHYPVGGRGASRRFASYAEGIFQRGLKFDPAWTVNIHLEQPPLTTPGTVAAHVAHETKKSRGTVRSPASTASPHPPACRNSPRCRSPMPTSAVRPSAACPVGYSTRPPLAEKSSWKPR